MKTPSRFQDILTRRRQQFYRYQKVKKDFSKLEVPEPPSTLVESVGELSAPAPRRGNSQKPQRFGREKNRFSAWKQELAAKREVRKQRDKEKQAKEKNRKKTAKVMKAKHGNGQPKLQAQMELLLERLQKEK